MATNEMLDVQFALFNCHINKAQEKVKILFIKRFGQDIWDKEIELFEKKGIMSIFDTKPTYHTEWYVEMMWYFVNQDKLDKLLEENNLNKPEQKK